MNIIKKISCFLALAMLLSILPIVSTAEVHKNYEPQTQTGSFTDENGQLKLVSDNPRSLDDDFTYTRVLLGTNSARSLTISLYGAYYVTNNMRSAVGNSSSPYTINVSISGNKVRIAHSGTTLVTASSVTINRVNLNENAGYLKINGCSGGLADDRCYLGNLRLSVNEDGSLRVINIVPTAHYLYGIVPYEMSESWLPDALRTQALACKSYAFAFPYNDDDYDITDSMSYQGYRGYTPGYTKCMQACIDVCGEMLIYNDQIVLTFFGSTNGGETDNPANVFGASPLESAYEVKQDNPDFAFATNKRETLEITYGRTPENANFKRLLEDEAEAAVGEHVSIVAVNRAQATTPKYSGSTRNMTKLKLELTVRKANGSQNNINLNLDITKLKSYGVFTKSYKIYWGESTNTGYNVYFCRYGHGLGLSQHGAQARALDGQDYHDILDFYFSKFDIINVTETNPELPYSYTQEVLAYGIVTGNSVNFRSGPSTDYQALCILTRNTHLDIVGEENGWLRCIANGKLGYISGAYVDIPLFPSPADCIFDYHSAIIRSACDAYDVPGTRGSVTASFAAGEHVTVRHTIGEYYYVTTNSGKAGFVPIANVDIRFYSLGSGLSDSMHSHKMIGIAPEP